MQTVKLLELALHRAPFDVKLLRLTTGMLLVLAISWSRLWSRYPNLLSDLYLWFHIYLPLHFKQFVFDSIMWIRKFNVHVLSQKRDCGMAGLRDQETAGLRDRGTGIARNCVVTADTAFSPRN